MSASPHRQLLKLLEYKGKNELPCAAVLVHCSQLLCWHSVSNADHRAQEFRTTSGDADYLVAADVQFETGGSDRLLYVWELKAPQCHAFERESQNRFGPSADLVSAETQLLHYHRDISKNESTRALFGVTSSDNVRLGGIIIGRSESLAPNVKNEHDRQILEHSMRLREQRFYRTNEMRLLTWDRVLSHLAETVQHSRQPSFKKRRKR